MRCAAAFLAATVLAVPVPAPAQDGEAAARVEGPGVDALVEGEILPRQRRLAEASLRLQNAVVRHCTVPGGTTLPFVREAFARSIDATARAEPFAFTGVTRQRLSRRFLTGVAETGGTLERFEALIDDADEAPPASAVVEADDPGLKGLPAVEFLLLSGGERQGERFDRRCALAQFAASLMRSTARRIVLDWRDGARPPHWTDEPLELAGRLRLRDLVQGAIDLADRLDRGLGAFDTAPEENDDLPFRELEPNLVYLAAQLDALAHHVALLRSFAPEDSPSEAVLADAAGALTVARARFQRDVPLGRGVDDVRPSVGAARLALANRLPDAFGFDASAFVTPVEPRPTQVPPP